MPAQLQLYSNHPLTRGVLRGLPVLAVILLLLLLAWTTAQMIWQVLAPVPDYSQHSPSAAPQVRKQARQPEYAALIAARNLFGKADIKKVESKPVDAPETQLNLKLRGIYATRSESEGYALIATSSGPEKLYAAGDILPGNTRLSAVYSDRVILERSGRRETLKLVETKGTGGGFSRSSGRRGGIKKKHGLSGQVGQMRKEILKNPAKLAELVNAKPAYADGRFVGYRIITKRSHPVFNELNLQSGDIVTRVNGIEIDSPQKGMRILQQLARAKQVRATILRDGQTMELDHSL